MGNKQSQAKVNNTPKKHICVIGGGSSGLMVMKELLTKGHTVTCFELLPQIGGVYVKTYANTMLTTSSLLTAWSDYSDGKESEPRFWSAEDYLEYINNYAKKHDLFKHIHFLHRVLTCRKDANTGKWMVTVRGGEGCKGYFRCEDIEPDHSAQPRTLEFDGIAVCTGTNTWPSMPNFPGQECFKGELIHTDDYKNADRFTGKRVLVIGSGESGSDIANEISKKASKVAISMRGKHGHLIPRQQSHGRVTDLNTNRCRYSNPYVFGDYIGYVNQMVKKWYSYFTPDSDYKRILQKIAELNMKQGTSAFSKYGCKNEGFVTAMVTRNAELHRDAFVIQEHGVTFEDGSEFKCDAIVACTGYKNSFPFFDEFHPECCRAGMTPRSNYKQVMCIAHPGEIAFFGFARPAFGSIPPCVEMQCRLYALVLNGELDLPSREDMCKSADEDRINWETRFGYDKKRVIGLVDFQLYCDGIAEVIGCLPPLQSLFFTDPRVWFHIMFGPFTMHQYRLRGPYPDVKRAREVLVKQPTGDFIETSITATFLVTAKLLSMFGFSVFKPNNF